MTVPCRACPLRRQPLFVPFTAEEVAFMERFKMGELVVDPGTTLLMEGSNSPQLYTVLRGQGVRYKTLSNGRRQVINFLFPGDFTGLQAGLMGEMKHSVESRTRMVLCVFDRSRLWEVFRGSPQRAYDLTWIAAVEEHFLGETIASLGQRDAGQRIAWALLRIWQRLRAAGLGGTGRCRCPSGSRTSPTRWGCRWCTPTRLWPASGAGSSATGRKASCASWTRPRLPRWR
jgi:CRP-like cAMP-binding protein